MAEEPCVSAETLEFGKLPDGQAVHRITLTNSNSTSVSFLSYGNKLIPFVADANDSKDPYV